MATIRHIVDDDDGQIRAPQSPVSAGPAPTPAPTPAPDPEPAPTPIYQTPDWEIPTNYPPPKKHSSFRNSLTFLNTAAAAAAAAVTSRNHTDHPDSDGAAAEAAELESVPAKEENTTEPAPAPAPALGTSDGGGDVGVAAGKQPTFATTTRQRLDAVLPPHKKYVSGRHSRRFLLLGIILPIAILTFVVLPLAVGLGVGLSRRRSQQAHENLPLPDGNGDEIYTGDLTYYDAGLGACGLQSGDDEDICAIAEDVFDAAGASAGANPNANPLCGRRIRITRDYGDVEAGAGNRSVDVTVVDRCTGCGPMDLDLSPAAFEKLARRDSGRVGGSWAWLED